jgi:hypothetical protein
MVGRTRGVKRVACLKDDLDSLFGIDRPGSDERDDTTTLATSSKRHRTSPSSPDHISLAPDEDQTRRKTVAKKASAAQGSTSRSKSTSSSSSSSSLRPHPPYSPPPKSSLFSLAPYVAPPPQPTIDFKPYVAPAAPASTFIPYVAPPPAPRLQAYVTPRASIVNTAHGATIALTRKKDDTKIVITPPSSSFSSSGKREQIQTPVSGAGSRKKKGSDDVVYKPYVAPLPPPSPFKPYVPPVKPAFQLNPHVAPKPVASGLASYVAPPPPPSLFKPYTPTPKPAFQLNPHVSPKPVASGLASYVTQTSTSTFAFKPYVPPIKTTPYIPLEGRSLKGQTGANDRVVAAADCNGGNGDAFTVNDVTSKKREQRRARRHLKNEERDLRRGFRAQRREIATARVLAAPAPHQINYGFARSNYCVNPMRLPCYSETRIHSATLADIKRDETGEPSARTILAAAVAVPYKPGSQRIVSSNVEGSNTNVFSGSNTNVFSGSNTNVFSGSGDGSGRGVARSVKGDRNAATKQEGVATQLVRTYVDMTKDDGRRWMAYSPVLSRLRPVLRDFIRRYVIVSEERRREISTYEQGSDQWKDGRRHRMGGSNYSAAVGDNPYQSENELIQEMISPTFTGNDATRRGTEKEPYARRALLVQERAKFMQSLKIAKAAGLNVVRYANRVFEIPENVNTLAPDDIYNIVERGAKISATHNWVSSSTDGDIYIFGKKVGIIEIKTPQTNKAYPNTPSYYFAQIQGNMHVHEVGFCLFVCYVENEEDERSGHVAPLHVELFEYDRDYCEHYLFPRIHNFFLRRYAPAFLEWDRIRESGSDADRFLQQFAPPAILKSKSHGYDRYKRPDTTINHSNSGDGDDSSYQHSSFTKKGFTNNGSGGLLCDY